MQQHLHIDDVLRDSGLLGQERPELALGHVDVADRAASTSLIVAATSDAVLSIESSQRWRGRARPRWPYASSATVTGHGSLSRNYDFFVGSIADLMRVPEPPDADPAPAVMSEPYLMEWHPEDGGYASLAIHSFDTLSGTLDGINSAGLAVAMLADEEGMQALGPNWEPHPGQQLVVGLHELAVLRLLLDTCATAFEAAEALLTVKQYYRFIPCRYLVADLAGHSFVYENSTGRNAQYGPHRRGQLLPRRGDAGRRHTPRAPQRLHDLPARRALIAFSAMPCELDVPVTQIVSAGSGRPPRRRLTWRRGGGSGSRAAEVRGPPLPGGL
jgi:hypothetical protein